MLADSARAMAARVLEAPLPGRWAHVVSVAETAADLGNKFDLEDDRVVAAAWLHDIGYAPELVRTGLHALDGARYLRDLGWDDQVVTLVAHHSAAPVEAAERGLDAELLREFPEPTDRTRLELLWYCDMTTGPSGERVSVEDRLTEIRDRYGQEDVVTRFIERAEERLVAAVRGVESRLALVDASRGTAVSPRSEST
jgi:putative nucleotidyltransferase with HDIG domain